MADSIHQSESTDPSRDLIVRIDERTKAMDMILKEVKSDVSALDNRVTGLEQKVSELAPVRMIVFGGVGLVLVAVVTALLGYILTNGAK